MTRLFLQAVFFLANDSIFFFENDTASLNNLRRIIDWYGELSDHSINLQKSELLCSPNIPPLRPTKNSPAI
uniref:Uncharacterized protein n=1 Tax=Quercus lobata TaxID=97700 RepID=A0A7N2KVK2_QUELO